MASTSVVFDILAKDRASDKFQKVGSSADRAGGKLAKMGTIAKVGMLGLATGVGVAVVGLAKLTAGAMEDESAQKRLAKTLQNTAGATDKQIASVEDWITAQGKAFGVADDDLRPALDKLAVATGSVSKSQKLASLAMNVSAGTGKDLGAVSAALAKAYTGNVGGLGRLGIATKDAEGKTKSFAAIQADLAQKFQGQASTAANTLEGRMGRLKLMLSEAGESIGAKLIPPLTALTGWVLNRAIPAISQFSSGVQTRFGPVLSQVAGVIQTRVVPVLQTMGNFIVNRLIPAYREGLSKALAGARSAFSQVSGAIEKNKPQIQQLLAALGRLATFIVTKVYPALGFLVGTGFRTLGVAISLTITSISGLVRAFNGIRAAVTKVSAWVSSIPGKIKGAFAGASTWLWNAGASVIQGFINGIQSMVKPLTDKLGAITKLIPKHKGPPSKDKVLLTPAGQAIMEGLLNGMKKKWSPVKDFLEKLTDKVAATRDKVKSLTDTRNDFASGFQSFGSSIFGRDPGTDAEGNQIPETVKGIRLFAYSQQKQAAQLASDVKRLVGLGLSKDLIKQMQANGSSGIAQIRALASNGSAADIRALNLSNYATARSLQTAGMTAGNAVYGDDLAAAKREARAAKAVSDAVAKALKPYLDKELHVELKGSDLLIALRREQKKQTGKSSV